MKSFHVQHDTIWIETCGKGTTEITERVRDLLSASGIMEGGVMVFVRHTSCSLVIMENADPSSRRDLHEFFDRLVPENTAWFQHTCEGPDDMPSHLRMALNGIPHSHEYRMGFCAQRFQRESSVPRLIIGLARYTSESKLTS